MNTTLTLALKRPVSRKRWTPSEDLKLRELVAISGPRKWKQIGEKMQRRTGNTCRMRWYRHLDPMINKRPFSEEEEAILVKAHDELGNKWSLIAKKFVGRSDQAVANEWHKLMKKNHHHQLALLTPHVSISQPSSSSSSSIPFLALASSSFETNIPPKFIDFLGVEEY